jgi:hydroxymethylglutaryl-CoA lyase
MREGMQIESAAIPVEAKIRLLDALSRTGLESIVVGSFVSPRYTPQMAEIDALVDGFTPRPGVTYSALALNSKGQERAAQHMPPLARVDRPPMLFTHLCDTFVRRNANMSQADEIARWPAIIDSAKRRGAPFGGIAINAAFGSNFEGQFSLDERMDMLSRQHRAWTDAGIPVRAALLGDPMSWCMPHWMEEQLEVLRDEWPEISHFYLHLHDGRGMALPTSYAALRLLGEGDDLYLDTTAGGIGGCPYCGTGRATGMAATEDLVNMLEEMGIETGVDLDALIEAVWLLEEIIGRQAPGHVSKTGPLPRGDQLYDPNIPFVETFEEARHFRLGPAVVEGQVSPWREPIPAPRVRGEVPRWRASPAGVGAREGSDVGAH